MKKRWILCLLLALTLLFGSVATPVFAENSQSGCYGIRASQSLAGSGKVLDTAKSVILYEMTTDTMVYSYNPDQKINPTGLVKLLTVLVALDAGDLDQQVQVYQTTLNTITPGSVSAGLKADEVLSLRELIYCIMVSSANDACAVVAAHLGGNQAGFVQMMNEKAADLGCTGSNFTNAHGLTDPEQYSTARDLAIITKTALENPLFTQLFAVTEHTVPATNKAEERKLTSTNHMMRPQHANYDSRITGGKPAAATNTDRSMICTAEIGTARYLCVVIGARGTVSDNGLVILRYGIFEEVQALMNYARDGFAVRQILDDEQTMYQYPVENGQNDVFLRPSRDMSVVLPVECDISMLTFRHTLEADGCSAPIAQGQKLGSLTICYGELVMGSCDLLAATSVETAGSTILEAERLDVPDVGVNAKWKKWLANGLLILLVVAVLAAIAYLAVRLARNAKIRKQQRRRARERKRSR